ncbi:MAG: hypothetical protein ACRD5M_07630 [Candidatus Acidiferrales bacterium]
MSNDPTRGIIPRATPRTDRETAEVVQQVESQPGEIELDAVIRAQSLAPEVRQRIMELENCLWALAERLQLFVVNDSAVERAKILLLQRLEIPKDK